MRRTQPGPRPMIPSDIRRQVVLEEHDVSRDGRFAVVVRRFIKGNAYQSHLWVVPLGVDGGRPRQLTRGAVRDTFPRMSPTGSAVAFRRERREGKPDHIRRLMVVDLAGGEPWSVTTGKPFVSDLAWSPGGDRLAFTEEVDPVRFIVGPKGSKRTSPAESNGDGDDSPVARRIRRIDWRWDEAGHVDRWEHLLVVPSREGARARQLTRGDFGVSGIAWHPAGGEIAFVADRGPEPDLHPRTTVWSIPATPGPAGTVEPREILALGSAAGSPAFSPDGRWLAAIGVVEPDGLDDVSPGLVVGPADGSRPAVALAPALDRPVGAWQDTDLNGWVNSARSGPFWTDASAIVALVTDRGRSVPWRFPVDPRTGGSAGPPSPLLEADAACWSLAVSARPGSLGSGGRGAMGGGPARAGSGATRPLDLERVSVVGTLGGRAMELMTVEGSGHEARFRRHTTIGSAWQCGLRQPEMRLLSAEGAGGPIDVWLASPPDAGDEPLPAIVDIHGGPLGAWAPAPSIEVMLLVSRGYRVLLPNIRGSASYGRDWIRPQLGDWGGVDAADVHAALDHAIALGLVDPARVGILGLSYGGFVVNWLVGTTDRFRAAVSENGVTNLINGWANSDSGPEYHRAASLGAPLDAEGIQGLWRQSPLANVANVRTPLLMLQAEADLRCPAADNEQFFVALSVLRREVEYVLYPDEYHTFAITGRPDRRVDRNERMLAWFDDHLRGTDPPVSPSRPQLGGPPTG